MAKLDQIILKTSIESKEDLIKTMLGTNPNVDGLTAVERGELVIRRDTDTGAVELWTLNSDDQPTQASVDITGLIPDFDPEVLDVATLDNIGDVDYEDGNPDGLSPANAGWVLTWDGQKWVVRPQAALEFDGGVIPSLNYIGDVNYSHYADGFPKASDPGKFVPSQHDVLWWEYNYNTSQYEWAPIPFRLEYLQDVSLGGVNLPGTSERDLILNSTSYRSIVWGNGSRGIWDNANGVKVGNRYQYLQNSGGTWRWHMNDGVTIYATDNEGKQDTLTYGIKYHKDAFPTQPPDDLTLITLRHAREDFGTRSIGDLSDVNTAGVLQGQVLVWNSLTGYWEPGSGPAPDFSEGSISELKDVEIDNVRNRQQLIYRSSDGKWVNSNTRTLDLRWDYCETYNENDDPENFCLPCSLDDLGRIITYFNVPHICLRKRRNNNSQGNDTYGYVRMLHDGWNNWGTAENTYNQPGRGRTDPLSEVAYEGQLGNLYNVSTADAFPNATIVYDWASSSFRMGYPALDLSADSIGELGDVCAVNAGIGYGLIWNGTCWEASSLEQKIRLDDLQDVQFGELGIKNDKLVAAYMLTDGEVRSELRAEQDLSPSLAVSTPKADAQLGTTFLDWSPVGALYDRTRRFDVYNNWTLPQKLDAYVRWAHDGSWQTIDGDGCIEIWFYAYTLLDNRTIFRKEAIQANAGGYILRINEDGSLYFSVTGALGSSGFSIQSPINFVSMNNWHHVAVTREGNVNRLYMDGDLIGSKESVASWTGDGMFTLGRNDLDDNNTLTHDFFRGFMFDLRVTKGRPKYNGSTYTLPVNLETELIDTTPQAGDFLSYNGTVWTNVAGVTADISSNSITELADVDTTSRNPENGDALVWTGEQWEPGIPGIGATWGLGDMYDVSVNYQAGLPWVRLDLAEALIFNNTYIEERDNSYLSHQRGVGTRMSFIDGSYTCDPYDPTSDGPYSSSHQTYFEAQRFGTNHIRSVTTVLKNVFSNCSFPAKNFHTPQLQYEAVPGTGDGDGGAGITTSTFVPAVGNIEAAMNHYLGFGNFGSLSDVTLAGAIDGMALIYRDGEWIPSSEIAADISQNSITDLGDVDTAGATEGMVLTYDESGTRWIPTKKSADLNEFPEFGSVEITSTTPLSLGHLYNARPSSEGSGQHAGTSPSKGPNRDNVFDVSETGYRGIRFYNGHSLSAGYGGLQHIMNRTGYPSLVLWTNGAGHPASFELHPDYARIASTRTTDNIGFRMASGWKVVYEDPKDWGDYGTGDLIPKSALIEQMNHREANLDLSIYSVDDLGDVDSTGKGQGWALTWDVESATWVATDGVAANLQLSSIGELKDVEKQANTDTETNDGWISFDVGGLRTSRPHSVGGGLSLSNQTGFGAIRWSDVIEGAPLIYNEEGLQRDGLGLDVWTRWESDRITVKSNQGMIYTTHPTLGDLVVPSWQQVQQQIVKQQTDFTALFLLTGNELKEEIYDWQLDWQMTTQPNPAYFSKFGGEWSLNFSRDSQDKVLWQQANGAPESWPKEKLYSIEFWVWIDDSANNLGGLMEYIVAPVASDGSGGTGYTYANNSSGIHIGIRSGDRSTLFATVGTCYGTNTAPTSTYVQGTVTKDAWNHVYFAQEGEGRFQLFVNGVKAGSINNSSAIIQNNGFAIGGRNTGQVTERTYFTGFIDDFRITDGWLPYPAEQETVPVPVQPLEGGAWTYKYGTLDQLTDTSGTDTALHGQVLTYNAIDEVWEPGDAPGYDVSANSISDFNDVDTSNSTPDQDDVLTWNDTDSVWQRRKVDGLGGVRPLNARSATPGAVPQAGTIFAGELFLNMADRTLWALDSAGQPFQFANGDLEDKINEIDRVVGGDF